MKTCLLSILLMTASSAFAQLAIYNFTSSHTIVGQGIEAKVRATGVLVVDLANKTATRVTKFKTPAGKEFSVDDETGFTIYRAEGPTAVTALVTSSESVTNANREESHVFFAGKESLVNLGTTNVYLPKSMKGAGYGVIDSGGAFLYGMSTASIAHSLSQKETTGANTRGETLEQAVDRWRQTLIAQGYTETEED